MIEPYSYVVSFFNNFFLLQNLKDDKISKYSLANVTTFEQVSKVRYEELLEFDLKASHKIATK